MHLQEWWSVKLLKESLMAYAGAISATATMSSRALMWSWSFKLLEILRNLARVPHLTSSGVKIVLATTMVEKGDQYCCGNGGIQKQLQHWVSREQAKKART